VALRSRRGSPALPPLLDEWAHDLAAQERSPRTIAGYLEDLRQFAEWLGKPLEQADRNDLRKFAQAMRGRDDQGLAPRTRMRRLVAIRRFYAYLVDTGVLRDSPAEELKLPRVKSDYVPDFLHEDEVGAVRAVFPDTLRGRRDRAMFELGISTLRASEVVGLQLNDLFMLDRGQVRIRGKGGGEYLQVVDDEAVRALGKWLEVRPVCRSPYVFIPLPPRGLRGLHRITAERIMKSYYRAAGITRPFRRPFHALRHTAGFKMGNDGVPLQYIQDIMRHADPRTSRIYARVDPETLREVIRRELRFPSGPRRSGHRPQDPERS
jgi:site-specific recombinase XerD